MKKILCIFLLIGSSAHAQLQALLSHSVFNTPAGKNYVEINLSVNGTSLKQQPTKDGKLQALIHAEYSILNRDEQLIYADKLNLSSPLAADSNSVQDFVHTQRVSLADGSYHLVLYLEDAADTSNAIVLKDRFFIKRNDSIHFSDITFLDKIAATKTPNSFSKNGVDMIPYPSQVFTTDKTTLQFYAELYRTVQVLGKEPIVLSYKLQDFETGKDIPGFSAIKKDRCDSVILVLEAFPIEELPSGNYELVLEVMDKLGAVIHSKRSFFQRINKNHAPREDFSQLPTSGTFVQFMTIGALNQYLDYLRPISSNNEIVFEENLLVELDSVHMQQFFLGFWQKRNAEDPQKAWENYLKEVQSANAQFTTQLQKGYQTDRGRVFLQYGHPDYINKNEYDRNVWPYEIWQYNRVRNQSNKRFVFGMVNAGFSTDEYRLIHSDVVGELNNPRWQNVLQKQRIADRDMDKLKGKMPKDRFLGDDVLDRDF